MAYGLGTRAFIEDGPAEQVARADTLRSTARAWPALDEARRLALSNGAEARQRLHRRIPAGALTGGWDEERNGHHGG